MSTTNCPHCGARQAASDPRSDAVTFKCNSCISGDFYQSDLCRERAARQKAEAESAEFRKTIEMVEREVALVYAHVTGGRFSKCNTDAQHVIGAADEISINELNEANRHGRMGWDEVKNLSEKLQKAGAELAEAKANTDSWRVQSDRFESQLPETSNQLTETRKELEKLKRIAWGAVHNARRDRRGRLCERWVAVRDAIGVGSSTARDLCREFGLDPNEGTPEAKERK